MRILRTKAITTLIVGAVFTAGLIMGFGGYVFAGDPIDGIDIALDEIPGGRVSAKNYSSLLSNKSVGLVRMEVGNALLGYGVGGADINKVTDALEGKGIYEAELKRFLLAIGINEEGVQKILLEFDKIGISKDGAQGLDAPTLEFTTGSVTPPAVDSSWKSVTGGELRTPTATTPQQPSAGTGGQGFKSVDGLDSETRVRSFFDRYEEGKSKAMQDLKAAESVDQLKGKPRHEVQANRETLQKSVETLRQNLRANAQELRDNFRENMRTTIGHVDHGKTGRIAVAHGKGLRMINRYRSAIARFDHILGRLESRIEKIGIEDEAQARATDTGKVKDYFPASVLLLIEEAKNMQVENEAKLAELEAKYESLLLGEKVFLKLGGLKGEISQGIGEEARAIAKELKAEIEKLHDVLKDAQRAAGNYNSSLSNKDK